MSPVPHSVVVHPATSADLPALQELHRALCIAERASGYDANADASFAASPSGCAYLTARINGDGLALIARDDDAAAGFLLAGVRSGLREAASGLDSMFVTPAFRRRGVGTALLARFLAWHRASGLPSASLAVAPANHAAIALYQKAGFRGATLIMERESTARDSNAEASPASSAR